MITVNQALSILLSNIPAPRIEKVALVDAHACYLGEDILAPEPSPRYTNSAMDGFAVRWQDCAGASENCPATLAIVGESQAGIPYQGKGASGEAVRISTGAMLPEGFDTVIRIEDTREKEGFVDILVSPALGKDVRYAGEEFRQETILFRQNSPLGARQLALLAAVGIHEVAVYASPAVSLLVTGTELAQPHEKNIEPHQIRDSNSIMLASAVKEAGAKVSYCLHIEDSLSSTITGIEEAIRRNDNVILCSGGVSVGRHDHVKDAAHAAGFTELFWKIRQKPGKPLFVGRRNNTLLFGLPGNPVSAFMCFINYVRPVLTELLGGQTTTTTVTAKTREKLCNGSKRTHFIRVNVNDMPNRVAEITEMAQQGSHMLSTIVHADGYIILQPGEELEAGSLVEVFLF